MTLEEKVDLLLKWKQNERRWRAIKTIVSLILFIVFIVIPIIGLYKLYTGIDFSAVSEAYENLSDTAGGLDKINELLNNI